MTEIAGSSTSMTITGNDNVVFEPTYNTNQDFANLLIEAYNAGYDIRVPALQFILENTNVTFVSSISDSGLANSETEPNIEMTSSYYNTELEEQVGLLPVGYLVTIMTNQMIVDNVEISNLTYQNQGNGVWQQITSYEFNTIKPIINSEDYP